MLLLRDWRTDVVGKVDDFVQARKFTEEHSGNVDAIIIANLSQQIMRISGNLFFQNEIPILFVGNHLLDIDVLNWILRNKNGSYVAKNDLEYSLAQAVILTIQKVFVSTPTIRKQIEIYRPNNHLPKITNLYRSNKLLLWPKTKQEIIEQEIIKQFVIYNFSRSMIQNKLHISKSKIGQTISRLYDNLEVESYFRRDKLFKDDLLNFFLERELKNNRVQGNYKNNSLKQILAFHILTTLETD